MINKKLLILVLVVLSKFAFAQNIIIKDYNGNDISNSTYTHTPSGSETQEASLLVELRSGSILDKVIAVKRYEITSCSTTENYFCWFACYGAVPGGYRPVWTPTEIDGSAHVKTVMPNLTDSSFHAYYNDLGTGIDGKFRFVFYDTSNVNDTASVIITFNYGLTSCDSVIGNVNDNKIHDLQVYPNPTSNVLFIRNAIANQSVEIFNVLGDKIYVNSATEKHLLNDMSQGIYFVRVIEGDMVVYSEKGSINKSGE